MVVMLMVTLMTMVLVEAGFMNTLYLVPVYVLRRDFLNLVHLICGGGTFVSECRDDDDRDGIRVTLMIVVLVEAGFTPLVPVYMSRRIFLNLVQT